MGKELELSNFKCKKCGKALYRNGKTLGDDYVFYMCLFIKNGGCGKSFWINIKTKTDSTGHKY